MLTTQKALEEINRLTDLLLRASEAYYNSGEVLMEDEEFDLMLGQLASLESQFPELARPDSPNKNVGTPTKSDFKKSKHQTPMLSLENLSTPEELAQWGEQVEKKLDGLVPLFCCEAKLDGLSMSVIFEKGRLVRAVTRGNGEVGDEVTENVKTIKSLPHQLKEPLDLELRGEVVMSWAEFEKNRAQFPDQVIKNPRNFAAGSLRLKDPALVKKRGLDILLYDLVTPGFKEEHQANLILLEGLGLPVNPFRELCHNLDEVLAFCQKTEALRDQMAFKIDGVVIKINHLEQRARLGRTQKSPVWARAWKFRPQRKLTRLLGIENSLGRTGVLTPVALVEPVDIDGTEVRRASLHNYKEVVDRLHLHEKDWVFLEKGGDIIPKVVSIDLTQRLPDAQAYAKPQACPSCQGPLTHAQKSGSKPKEDGTIEYEIDQRCTNARCPAQLLAKIEHFVSKKAMDVSSLGAKMVELLMQKGFVAQIDDLFRLKAHRAELEAIKGLGDISVAKFLNALETAKTQPLDRLIIGLGINNVGERAAKTLALFCKDLNHFKGLSLAELESIPEFGPVMVQSVLDWTKAPENQDLLLRLTNLGVNPEPLARPQNQPFKGKSVCITGTLSKKRSDWKFQLEQLGFKTVEAVSAKTDYLLAGEEAGSKLKKAQQLNIPILSEKDMNELIESGPTL
ncbi:MAG: DNA ligase (NAD(+)) LigA [Candidatus Lambdaproteobacteria bacterium RIFOXYD12_FULL_49_8]|nr:MAG: DNA ligase (NAD(+)) LigA [Candidatus Lambdaproteobacteria bacterium RIFOXYD12_FULL_49_8]